MKVYVAGPSSEPERVRSIMDMVTAYGWTVTHDWLKVIEEHGHADPASREARSQVAADDLYGIAEANIFWLLAPEKRGMGLEPRFTNAWVELGYALALRQRDCDYAIVSSGVTGACIFASHGMEFPDDQSAWAHLRRLERVRTDQNDHPDHAKVRAASFMDIAEAMGNLVAEKNAAYGNAFETAGEALKLLYPNGIAPEAYGDALTLVRIWDKLMRIATAKDAFGESPYRDIIGYGLLGAELAERNKP